MPDPQVICLTNGAFAENCYIVADRAAGEAVLIDPGEEADLFMRRLASEGLKLKAIWLTHAHVDHILGVARVVDETGVTVYLHPDDLPLYGSMAQQAAWLGLRVTDVPPPTRPLTVGDQMTVGGLSFEVRHVPGHCPGGVAFVGHGIAIVGDALFAGSIGRTDLPGGDTETLLTSIREQLLSLPDSTTVYAGHGPPTTIGAERRRNPFLTGMAKLV